MSIAIHPIAAPAARRPAGSVRVAFLLLGLWAAPAAHGQDAAAERLYREAQRLEQAGDAAAALEELELLVRQFPSDAKAPGALLDTVRLRRAAGDVDGARSAVRKLLDDYPRSAEAAAGFVEQAEIEVDVAKSAADLEEARKSFRRVPLLYGRERYPNLPQRGHARIRSGEIGLLLGDEATAVADFLAAIEDEPTSVRTGRARLGLATALLRIDEWAAAAEVLQRLADEPEPEAGEPGAGLVAPVATSTAGDRQQARHLLSFLHRHFVRPAAGQPRWRTTARFPVGTPVREPSAVAAALDGRALLVERRSQWLATLSSDGQILETRTAADPERPGWDGNAPFLATASGLELPLENRTLRLPDPRPGKVGDLKDVLVAERDLFGRWLVLSKVSKGILVYDDPRTGRELLADDKPDLVDLARGPRGRIHVLDRRARTVRRLGLDGADEGALVTGAEWRRPAALDVDRLGQVYVLDRGNRTVEVFDAQGRPVARLGPLLGGGVELRSPVDLAVDGDGRLFIADEKISFLVVLE